MSVGEICNRDVIVIGKEDSISEAARRMREHHVGALVVSEMRAGVAVPVGFVTDRDLVIEVLAEEVDPNDLRVGDIMSRELLTVRESDGIWDTLQRMRNKGVRRAPVVTAQGGLAGIVAVDDLLELFAEELVQLSKLVVREQAREIKTRP